MAFTPSGDRLLVGSRSGWVYVWDTASWKEVDRWQAHTDWVSGMAIDPNGDVIYTGSHAGDIKQWRLKDHQLQKETKVTGEIDGLSLTKDRLVVAAQTSTLLTLADLAPLALPPEIREGVSAAASYRGGASLLIGTESRLLQINTQPPQTTRELSDPRLRRAHQFPIHALGMDPRGRFAVSTDTTSAKVWDCVSGTFIGELHLGSSSQNPVEFLSDGAHFAIAANGEVQIFEIDVHPGWSVNPTNSDAARDAALNGDGKVLAEFREQKTAPRDWVGAIHAGPLDALQPSERLVSSGEDNEIVLSSDGTRLLFANIAPPRLDLLNTADMRTLKETTCGTQPQALALDESGKRVYFTAKVDSKLNLTKPPSGLFVWDLQQEKPQLLWSNWESQAKLSKSKILAIAVGKRWLATSSIDGKLRIHKAGDGSVVKSLPANPLFTRLAFAKGQSHLIAGDELGGISVLALPGGERLYHVAAHLDEVSGLTTSPDGQVISVCRGGQVRLWRFNVESESLIAIGSLGPLSGPIRRLAASQDGQVIAILVEGESAARILKPAQIRKAMQMLGLDW
jgi:FOG: WD40 repeat